ncbi:unnamed protein product [Penicillium salamii]|uniref:Mg2+ transporter protein, CorA-like/Zinc transport protein ZntB n=1 Tax=Penicillium salamii TaxID=1612424 RepID=A0A9W4IYB0_9EURO|nr:unnamed protein product [Penicillium salamii]CAG7965552.1 unnamed protein product [Penicillium salamii]CAG8019057.1 unnamed protein product [Penicillium salamii]CAG8088591.1 unnamed protein product [Penicillium salamii]CAG8104971.1 unnamed protein product [Penicillium salamii]
MREAWWSDHYRKSNGYFGCETTRKAGKMTGVNTWSFFEVKQLPENMKYYWDKLNVFTRWVASTKQTIVVLFDSESTIRKLVTNSLLKFNPSLLEDPYWAYPTILDTVANRQESAVWLIRNQVRQIEKKLLVPGAIPGAVPKPNFRSLHNIGRHAIHVCETLDVAVQTIESVQMHHLRFLHSNPEVNDLAVDQDVRAELEFHRSFIANLRHRSTSNEKRLRNEIQLAFNTVAQHNAGTSVEIGRAAQIDSSAMKTIAFVTLIFLPPTFISSLFSMSFFQCGPDNGWGVSNKFWLYWVFAIPITVATGVVWQYWHNLFPNADYKPAPVRAAELPVRSESVMPKMTVEDEKVWGLFSPN